MAKQMEQSAEKNSFFSIILILGGFSVFLILVAFVWSDRSPSTVARGGPSRAERLEILHEQRAQEQAMLTEYGWVDQDQGIVRLPIERAMELVLEEMNQGQN